MQQIFREYLPHAIQGAGAKGLVGTHGYEAHLSGGRKFFEQKITPTKVLQEASVVREGLLEEVTFKKGLERRVFKVEETASAQSHSLVCKPGGAVLLSVASPTLLRKWTVLLHEFICACFMISPGQGCKRE